MTDPQLPSRLPAGALREFEKMAASEWGDGVPLAELLDRVNRVAAQLITQEDGQHSRVKRLFTERSFRRYQTLGCIDPPEREGHRALYGYRHFVQALLVRRLLWERLPSEQIAVVMAGRGTGEIEQMFLGGVQMVARAGEGVSESGLAAPEAAEKWRRVQVAPGVELHLRDDLKKLKPEELGRLAARVETALQRGW